MTEQKYFTLIRDDRDIGTLVFDTPNSSANIFTRSAIKELEVHIDTIAKENTLKALFITSAKKDIFIAGADILEIKDANDEQGIISLVQSGQDVFTKLENLPFPTIAVIDGACLGGGLEMSMACTYRIATSHPHTRIGLPEVNLGILPGFGGTQRLPQLVGYAKAMELILGSKRLRGEKALKLGVVDACVPLGYLEFKIEEFCQAIFSKTLHKLIPARRTGITWYEKLAPARKIIGQIAKKKVLAKTQGNYPAPLAVLDVMQESFGKPLTEGLKIEREAVTKLALTSISKNLIELFLISEQLKKETFSKSRAKKITSSAVVGTGAMGSGIAWALNNQEISVRLKDINNESIVRAIRTIRSIYEGIKKRGRLTEREISLKMDKITFTTDYVGFETNDILIEAVSEDRDLKRKIFSDFEKILPPDAIIASNTSSLSISELAKEMLHPNRFIGMHFFNPVDRMPLVEIITGEKTDDKTIATVVALTKRMGKTPIKVKESAGFLVNRILLPYLNEAAIMFEEGEDIHKIDSLFLAFGMPMGPFTLVDKVGVDIGEKVSQILHEAFGDRMAISNIMTQMVEKNWLGVKTGTGFYIHSKAQPKVNKELSKLQKSHITLDEETIKNRAILTTINEAARCLEERVVDSAGYLDMAMVMGTGFPAFRGGLLRYADTLGIGDITYQLNEFSTTYGDRFTPCDLLGHMAATNTTFYGGKA